MQAGIWSPDIAAYDRQAQEPAPVPDRLHLAEDAALERSVSAAVAASARERAAAAAALPQVDNPPAGLAS